jgi:DNA-binding response OmpR family regulator
MAHILVIDDDPAMLDMLTLALHTQEQGITTCKNIQEAEDKLSTLGKPDCILLDVHLGNEDGTTFIAHHPELKEKIVMLTNDDSSDTVAQYILLGISDYLVKASLNFDVLKKLVEKKKAL